MQADAEREMFSRLLRAGARSRSAKLAAAYASLLDHRERGHLFGIDAEDLRSPVLGRFGPPKPCRLRALWIADGVTLKASAMATTLMPSPTIRASSGWLIDCLTAPNLGPRCRSGSAVRWP
jgi:hypothetical protein